MPERRRRQRALPGGRVQCAEVRHLRHAAQQWLQRLDDRSHQRRNPGLRRARQLRRQRRRLARAVSLDPEQREQHRNVLRAARHRPVGRASAVQVDPAGRFPDQERLHDDLQCRGHLDRRCARSAGRAVRGDDGIEWPARRIGAELAEPAQLAPGRGFAHVLGRNRAGRAFRDGVGRQVRLGAQRRVPRRHGAGKADLPRRPQLFDGAALFGKQRRAVSAVLLQCVVLQRRSGGPHGAATVPVQRGAGDGDSGATGLQECRGERRHQPRTGRRGHNHAGCRRHLRLDGVRAGTDSLPGSEWDDDSDLGGAGRRGRS
jgi:hypothetical protein